MSEAAPDLEPLAPPSTIDFPVVGVGASAGGFKALLDLFGAMPPDTGMAFVVILHLSPEHESHFAELLQRVTSIPIVVVTAPEKIEKDRIYVISPKSYLVMQDGSLQPVPQTRRDGGPLTIDRFFETLAHAHRTRAFAIVLSGSGSDGTRGAKTIKAHGGVTLVQSPGEAEYDSMPLSAIANGAADFVLAARDMPAKLAALWRNAALIRLPELAANASEQDTEARTEEALREVLALTRARTQQDFSQYKRPTLLRRIERRLQVNQLRDLPSYRDFVREHPAESRNLLRDLLISVTSFFRDEEAFEALEKTVIPALFAEAPEGSTLRVWVVGCATGEEVYSIAMLLAERATMLETSTKFVVFATDIDEPALGFARAALYPESIREQTSSERLQRFFVKEANGYRVQKPLRATVMFAAHNVLQDPPFSRVNLIGCRNLLIYFDREAQRQVLDFLHVALRPDGYLFLGRSESVEERDGFVAIDASNRIYQKQPRARTGFALTPTAPAVQPPADMVPARGRRLSFGDLHLRMLEHYGPPSVVVDDRYDVVHLSDSAGSYLQLGPGEPSMSFLGVMPEELRFELRSALDQAMQSMQTVQRLHLPLRRGPEVLHVDVKVHPVHDRSMSRTFALVLFEDVTERDAPAARAAPDESGAVRGIEDRLHETEERIRAVVEEYEVQNEEAKAANEELQATNEELRATSEELETGREELQSINEELSTVNQELRLKIDEATRIGDDLANFIHATRIPALFVDLRMRVMRFTPTATQLFNVIDTDIGHPLLDITHRLDHPELADDIRGVIGTLGIVERELRSNDRRTYAMRALPYRTKDDRIGGVVLTFFDVTERKKVEEAVRASEAWLKLVMESVRDYAILRLDSQGRIATWNPAAETIFGYSEAEAIGQPFEMLFVAEDRAAGVPQSILATARETGRAESDRWKVRKDGSRFFARGVTAPLPDPETFGYVKVLQDLTQRHADDQRRDIQLEDERAERSASEDANVLKDQFLATLSHELRNPLALILMQSELLLRAPEVKASPQLASAAGIIRQMVHAQSRFVDDMLDVSRMRAGKLALDRQLLPLALVLADSIGALRREAEENAVTLELDFTPEPLFVEADVVRVRQIAWNLLSNALKFTPRGGRIIVRLVRDRNFARLEVEDTGQGIAPDVLPRIFDWFSQGEAGATRRQGGMGIGLALVKQLVELHGGRVTAHSDGLGKGAKFTVCLPLQTSQTGRNVTPGASTSDRTAGRIEGVRILVIDDLPDSADSMRQLLEIEGAKVTAETRSDDAIRAAHTKAFDVIISDIAMPDMDGHTMLREIRAGPLNASTPAIAHSGYGGPEDIARSAAAGFQLHLTKPTSLEELIEAIESVRK